MNDQSTDTIELTAERKVQDKSSIHDFQKTVKNIDWNAVGEKIKAMPVIGDAFKPKARISVIRLSGIIADSDSSREARINYKTYAPLIEDAFDDDRIKAVALIINCPGGSPAQSELIGQEIRRHAEDKNIPVIAFVEDVAASGGYWIACAADEIIACETSIVGSIGVISASFGLQGLIEKHGIERRVHTAGKAKSFMDPFVAEKPSDVTRLKEIQVSLHKRFIQWVQARRAGAIDNNNADIFEGNFWLAQPAQQLGVIDSVGYIHQTLQDRYGKNVKIKTFAPEKGFFASLIGGGLRFNMANDLLETAENKAFYDRYGL